MNARSQSPKDEGPWLWIARDGFERASELSGYCVAVYAALAYFESRASAEYKQRFMVSLDDLAERSGFSRRKVSSTIKQLKDAGLINTVSGSNKKQFKVRNAYCMLSVYRSASGALRSAGNAPQLSASGAPHLSAPRAPIRKRENSYAAPPQAAAGVTNKEEEGDARSPSRGGGAPQKTDLLELSDEEFERRFNQVEFEVRRAEAESDLNNLAGLEEELETLRHIKMRRFIKNL